MIRLNVPQEPFDIQLAEGISVTVKPVNSLSALICKQIAQNKLDQIVKSSSDCEELGLLKEADIDLANPMIADAMFHTIFIEELAVKHIVGWKGVVDESDNVAPLSENNIRAAMTIWPFTELFYPELVKGMTRLNQAKKDSGADVNGTSSLTEAPTIATDASDKTLLAHEAGLAITD